MLWNVTALFIGAALGILSGVLWRWIVSGDRSRTFYKVVGRIFHSMLTDRDANFPRLYKSLISATARFLGVQALGMGVAFSPLITLCWLAGPVFHERRNAHAEVVSVYPATDARSLVGDKAVYKDGRVPISALPLSAEGGFGIDFPVRVDFDRDVRVNQAISPDGWIEGYLLASLGFKVTFVDATEFGGEPHSIIVRPWCGDSNPLWPYLSDPELYFFTGMGLLSFPAILLFRRKTKEDSEVKQGAPSISFVDHLLISIASAASGVFAWLGDKESWFFRDKLKAITIDRPIFVTGMARSGTTIMLELLSSIPSVATHQYRDFPFVMTPLFWHRFTTLFSSKNPPLERPHKDGIFITRESPEAFEEPIWQHFFPEVHKGNATHAIGENDGTESFASFFSDHIRKILLIRNGTRYLSKGNYNLTRIGYLTSLFPDARFVIPVRHPIEHVWSLVRQNELFQKYAEQDDRVPDYLRAAGHYEFGPQRVPVCLQEKTCQNVLDAWRRGGEHIGYAIQWAEIYRFVSALARQGKYADRIFFLRYEDLCESPVEMLIKVVDFCGLQCEDIESAAARIMNGRVWSKNLEADIRHAIWEEVREVAEKFGYEMDGVEKWKPDRTDEDIPGRTQAVAQRPK